MSASFIGLCMASNKPPRAWFHRLSQALVANGFTASKTDSSLFFYSNGEAQLFVLVYVDDIIMTEVACSPVGITLCQRKYTLGILEESGMVGRKPSLFLMQQQHILLLDSSSLLDDPGQYRRLIGVGDSKQSNRIRALPNLVFES
ncbi:uncharacterized protein LOC109839383 [Asparagus officinalis]|uniref:uncharacterized protein LOC109839383 n=1 Tax=Asparagus officinalis TaxID=4686 RepID=UPI00098E7457|nr:uncharacterized protein LOC109839383 [Asparagus officinalis]